MLLLNETMKAGSAKVQEEIPFLGLQCPCLPQHPPSALVWELALQSCTLEVFLSLATASNPSLLHTARALGSVAETTVYSKFRGSVVLSNILHKLKQTNSKKIRTKEVITSAYFSKPSADTHTLCKSYSFQYIFSQIVHERAHIHSNQMSSSVPQPRPFSPVILKDLMLIQCPIRHPNMFSVAHNQS